MKAGTCDPAGPKLKGALSGGAGYEVLSMTGVERREDTSRHVSWAV